MSMIGKKMFFIVLSMFSGGLVLYGQNPIQNAQCKNILFNSLVLNTLSNNVPAIDVDTLYANKKHYLVLDARELAEYQVSHLEGAIHVGYNSPNFTKLSAISKHQPIAVYCSIGYRSEKVAKMLLDQGFMNVVNVYGSIFEWINRGYSIVDLKNCKTFLVHGYSRSWGIWIRNDKFKVVYK
jgi:rhodanese-related sulfurtransferase